jgi:hypothetical protein
MELLTVGLGVQTGLYAALRDGEPATAGQLAERAGVTERYAHEWLEQQATAGIVQVAVAGDPADRSYRLPAGHAEALLEPDSPGYVAAVVTLTGVGGVGKTHLVLRVAADAQTGYRDGVWVKRARRGAGRAGSSRRRGHHRSGTAAPGRHRDRSARRVPTIQAFAAGRG